MRLSDREKSAEEAEGDLTPMIDMTFQLIAFLYGSWLILPRPNRMREWIFRQANSPKPPEERTRTAASPFSWQKCAGAGPAHFMALDRGR